MKASLLESRVPLSHAFVLGTLIEDGETDRRYQGGSAKLLKAAQAVGRKPQWFYTLPDIFPVLLRRTIVAKEDGCGCFAEPVTVLRLVLHLDLIHGWCTNDLAAFVGACEVNNG